MTYLSYSNLLGKRPRIERLNLINLRNCYVQAGVSDVCSRQYQSDSASYYVERTGCGKCVEPENRPERIHLQERHRNLRREGAGGLRLSGQDGCGSQL